LLKSGWFHCTGQQYYHDAFGMAAPLIERTEEQRSKSRFVLLKCEVHGTMTVQCGGNCVIRREVSEWLKIFRGRMKV
jgi:hypothetical protein